jgi:xylulokinase
VIRAGKANLFLSDLFAKSFVNATGVPVELYNCDGSVGAAIGAGIGAGAYSTPKDAFADEKPLQLIEPDETKLYDEFYFDWKKLLEKFI